HARIWNTATRQPLGRSLEHEANLTHVAFSPDSRRLVTAYDDRTVRVWNVSTGQLTVSPLRHHGPLDFAEFSPDGRRVLSHVPGSGSVNYSNYAAVGWSVWTPPTHDSAVCVWDLAKRDPLVAKLKHDGMTKRALFSPDERHVL